MNVVNPCLDCEDRAVGCHSTCEKYISWKVQEDKRKEVIAKNKNHDVDEYRYEMLTGIYRTYEKKRRQKRRRK